MTDFGLSVVASVVGAGLAIILRDVFLKILWPKYQALWVRGACIDGAWEAEAIESDGTTRLKLRWEIQCAGEAVRGKAECYDGPEGIKGQVYRLEGLFHAPFLSLIYYTTARHRLDCGCLLLESHKGNTLLTGKLVFTNSETDQIGVCEYRCRYVGSTPREGGDRHAS